MSSVPKPLHRVLVDTDVFAALWQQRKPGEESENDILRRLYGLDEPAVSPVVAVQPSPAALATPASLTADTGGERNPVSPLGRTVHREAGTEFAEGFEISRGLKGHDYRAAVVRGGWRLDSDGMVYPSLAALNQAIGAGPENVWMAWFFRSRNNRRRPLDDYRLGKS